jgi:hypothetical protein
MEFLIFLNRFSTMKDRGEAAALIAVWRLSPPMLVTDHPRPGAAIHDRPLTGLLRIDPSACTMPRCCPYLSIKCTMPP